MHAQAVVRGSSRALVVVDMPFGSYRGEPVGSLSQRRAGDEGDRLRRRQARGRRPYGRDHPLSHRSRHPGDEPYRHDAAGREHDRQLQAAGALPLRMGRHSRRTHARSRKPAPSPWCSRRWRSFSPRASPSRSRSRPSASAPRAECDGQILVLEDMLGLSPRVPKFVKEYAQIGEAIETAVKTYASEVRGRVFPSMNTPIRCATSLSQSPKSPK